MSNKFERLEREDVVSVYSGQILVANRTFTVSEFLTAMMHMSKMQLGELTEDKENWFGEGLDCKILKPGGKTWQRGQVRITLEFCPEKLEIAENHESSNSQASQSESPLDPIRKMMKEDNQQNHS